MGRCCAVPCGLTTVWVAQVLAIGKCSQSRRLGQPEASCNPAVSKAKSITTGIACRKALSDCFCVPPPKSPVPGSDLPCGDELHEVHRPGCGKTLEFAARKPERRRKLCKACIDSFCADGSRWLALRLFGGLRVFRSRCRKTIDRAALDLLGPRRSATQGSVMPRHQEQQVRE